MWVNLGLFLLVWESLAVVAMVPLRLVVPEAGATDLHWVVGLSLPVAVLATRLVDHYWMENARLRDDDDDQSSAEALSPVEEAPAAVAMADDVPSGARTSGA